MCLRTEGHPTSTGSPGGPMERGLNPLRRENSLATTGTCESARWGWFWECGSWELQQLSPPGDHCWVTLPGQQAHRKTSPSPCPVFLYTLLREPSGPRSVLCVVSALVSHSLESRLALRAEWPARWLALWVGAIPDPIWETFQDRQALRQHDLFLKISGLLAFALATVAYNLVSSELSAFHMGVISSLRLQMFLRSYA